MQSCMATAAKVGESRIQNFQIAKQFRMEIISPQAGMRLRIGVLMKIQARADMSNEIKAFESAPMGDLRLRNSREIGEVLRTLMKSYDMQESRIGKGYWRGEAFVILEGEMVRTRRPERNCHFTFSKLSQGICG